MKIIWMPNALFALTFKTGNGQAWVVDASLPNYEFQPVLTLTGVDLTASDATDCETLCSQQQTCAYWSFRPATTSPVAAASCTLSDGDAHPVRVGDPTTFDDIPGVLSGVKDTTWPSTACGTGNHPSVNAGATWPGATAADSHSAWSTGRQPVGLECWPKGNHANSNAFDLYPASGDISVLQSRKNGWDGKCQNLEEVPIPADSSTDADWCENSCRGNAFCPSWQLAPQTSTPPASRVGTGINSGGCWQGVGDHCNNRAGADPNFTPIGAERYQHGQVQVLRRITDFKVNDLHMIFSQQYATQNNETFAMEACRKTCYSDLDCNYWQYVQETGCWTEAPSENSNVPNPLTNGDVDRALSGITILSGEFIQHWARPPQCPVIAVTNGNGTGGTEACGAGITFIADGADCTVQCATGYTPSAATATCANRVLAPVTCIPDACNVGTVTNAAGTGGAEPCGTGITSINDGNDCNVTCADGFRAHPAAATCAHGTLQSIECRVISPCTVVAVANASGVGGASPCGTGVTQILNGDECTVHCATGYHPSATSVTCTSGTLDPVTCVANLPCSVGTVTNANGTGGAEPCGTGITSIDDGNNCTVTCNTGFRAVPATATCTNGVLAPRECRERSPCAVVNVTNAAGAGGVSPCGTGITQILNGEQCTMQCATGFHPSAATATCTSGTLDPVTCVPNLPCSAGIVTNAAGTGRGSAGTGGNEPCGIGITSIADGDNCTVTCDSGYRAVPATATCTNGVLANRECRVRAPCTVVAVTNGAGIGGVSPCGAGVTTILNGEQCVPLCAVGFLSSVATATCTSGTLEPITCVAVPTPAPPASSTPWLLIGLILLALLIALLICIFLCFNDKAKSPKKRAVKPVKKKEPPAPPPPAPTQSRPVAVMMPTYVQAPQMVQAQPRMNTSFTSPAPQMAQAVQITPSMSLQSLQQPLARSPR